MIQSTLARTITSDTDRVLEVVIYGYKGEPYDIFARAIDALRIKGIARITTATGFSR